MSKRGRFETPPQTIDSQEIPSAANNMAATGYGMASDEQSASKGIDPPVINIGFKHETERAFGAIINTTSVSNITIQNVANQNWFLALNLLDVPRLKLLPHRLVYTAAAKASGLIEWEYYKLKHIKVSFTDIVLYVTDGGTGVQLMQDPIIEFFDTSVNYTIPTAETEFNLQNLNEFNGPKIKTAKGGLISWGFSPIYESNRYITSDDATSLGIQTPLTSPLDTVFRGTASSLIRRNNYGEPVSFLYYGRIRNLAPVGTIVVTMTYKIKFECVWHVYGQCAIAVDNIDV